MAWTIVYGTHPVNKRPYIELRQGEQWVRTYGRVGIDPDILFDRAMIEAASMDLEAARDRLAAVAPERLPAMSSPEVIAMYEARTTERTEAVRQAEHHLRYLQKQARIHQEMRREEAELDAAALAAAKRELKEGVS